MLSSYACIVVGRHNLRTPGKGDISLVHPTTVQSKAHAKNRESRNYRNAEYNVQSTYLVKSGLKSGRL
jgi:hypothetical protein